MAAMVEFMNNNNIEHTIHDSKMQIDFTYTEHAEPLKMPEGEEEVEGNSILEGDGEEDSGEEEDSPE